jgi:hypothetical protein
MGSPGELAERQLYQVSATECLAPLLKRIKAALLQEAASGRFHHAPALHEPCSSLAFEFEFNVLNLNLIGRPRGTPIIW